MKPIIVRRRWFSCSSVPVVRRQYGLAARTPRTWIYKPLKLEPLPVPTPLQWVRYYANVGTDYDFLMSCFAYLGLWFIPKEGGVRVW